MEFINIENKDEKLYTINNNINNKYIINFLSRNNLLTSVTNDKITFGADSLIPLNKIKEGITWTKFIYDLGSQILYLKDERIAIKYFSIKDIVIINSDIFLFINPNKFFALLNKKDIHINKSIKSYEYGIIDLALINKDSQFLPPELKEKISYIYYTSSFYSLAKLIIFVFDIELESLEYTEIYFFLTRCLEIIPENRIFLYI